MTKKIEMQCFGKRESQTACGLLLLFLLGGCGSSPAPTPVTAAPGPHTYLAPLVEGTSNGASLLLGAQSYVIDDAISVFSQTTHVLSSQQQGAQIINSGTFAKGTRGLLSLQVVANYQFNSISNTWVAAPPPKSSPGFALELAGQGGGFIQGPGQPVAPLVPTTDCPSISSPQTYQFLTIPGALLKPGTPEAVLTWNATSETAYGSFDISTSGDVIKLANISQFTLLGGLPTNRISSATGACGMTAFGNAISVPGEVDITNPGPGGLGTLPAQGIFNIGPSGLLVEDNGDTGLVGAVANPSTYQNAMGAGTGAIGLPRPSGALDTGAVTGAQYLGFIYGAGAFTNSSSPTGWSSHLVSFGFSSTPSSCASVAPSTSTMIYGGSFTNDDPSTSSTGFGNCDFAVDLGVQDASNHGLYAKATVWMGAPYPGNTTNATNSFPAVAIAGQLQGKFAIFLLGVDSKQPWAIYLLQSN